MAPVFVSHHSIERYCERVDRMASFTEARLALMQIVALGRTRSVPRHWMRDDVQLTPGLSFLHWSHRPDVCLLVRGGVVVTVVTRSMCTVRRRHLALVGASPRRDPRPADISQWRWNRTLDEEAA